MPLTALGTVIHGATFSKHFAAFSLSCGGAAAEAATRPSHDDDGTSGASSSVVEIGATSTAPPPKVVDVVLTAKDGWGVDLLGELCAELSLPGTKNAPPTPTSSSSSSASSSSFESSRSSAEHPEGEGGTPTSVTVEVEIVEATSEALEDDGHVGHWQCLHPTELRVRRHQPAAPAARGGDDSCASPWRTWHADAQLSKTTRGPTAGDDAAASSAVSEDLRNPSPTHASSSAAAIYTRGGAASNAPPHDDVVTVELPAVKKNNFRKIKKDNRASSFAALLVREFGLDRLRRGAGVVDVAGGSGELSFELAVRWGVPCTIVDPRGHGVHLTSRHKRLLASRAANKAMITAAWESESALARQLAREWVGYTPANAAHIKKLFNASLMDDPAAAALLKDCSAVVGLHPDQATLRGYVPHYAKGAIVDSGLVLRKPWAVVPCCVFPSLFPGRVRPSDGEPVRTTEALVEHLMCRAGEVEVVEPGKVADGASIVQARRCELPCEGASTAVWWCPPLVPPPSSPPSSADAEEAEAGAASQRRGREDWPWPSPPLPTAGGSGGPGPFKLPSSKESEM